MDIDTILKVIAIIMGSIVSFSAFVAAVVYLIDQRKKSARSMLQEDFDKINKKIDDFKESVDKRFDDLEKKHEKSDMEACKNFLVKCLDSFENDKKVSSVLIDRFWHEYDYYIEKGKNSSIKSRTQELVSSGQLKRITKGE
jgi:cell shape-determining protein MreC